MPIDRPVTPAPDNCPGISCRDRIVHWLRSRVPNPDDAEDIAGEICLHCRHGLSRFRGEAEFSTWLHRIAVNALIDYLRIQARKANREAALSGLESFQVDESAGLDAAQIRAVICNLTPRHRHVIEWKYGDGLTYAEIADRLDISVNAASQALYRARAALRKALGHLAHDTC